MDIRIKKESSSLLGKKKKRVRMWNLVGYPLTAILSGGVIACAVNPHISPMVFLLVSPIAVIVYLIRYRLGCMWERSLSSQE